MRNFSFLILIALMLTVGPASLWAHGGSHDAPATIKEETTLPELPEETVERDTTRPGVVDYGMDDSIESLGMEEVVGDGPLWGENQEVLPLNEPPLDADKMAGHEGHDMSNMKHVEPAEHQWVATSQKGYGWAAALTVLSGLVFGFLTFKRPCE
ncbi:MAG: hypothetical protein OEZ51_10530 [Nitrospinota bacterium]|nr:hypothetical protein [Nitrospinota bacterium]